MAWEWVKGRSQQGDAAGTLAAVRAAESFRPDWFDGCGGEFLADAADSLDRVGHTDLALRYLERARTHSDHEDFEVARAEMAILARSGDPDLAEQRLLAFAASPRCEPFEQWRILLLRAFAADRRGDSQAAELAVAAFEGAAQLGLPALPFIRERACVERLLGLVGGHPVAAALDELTFPVSINAGMPGLDGWAVAAQLRADPATASVRTIVLTPGGGPDEPRAEADACLAKPFDPAEVIANVRRLARRRA